MVMICAGMIWACPGSNAAGSRFSLQLRARITGLAGFSLQSLTRNAIVLIAIAGWLSNAGAQVAIPETRVEKFAPMPSPPHVITQPLVTDTSLLFLAPDLVWRCSLKTGGSLVLYDADFANVERCDCRREVYELVPDQWWRYVYRATERELRATLVRTSATSFMYSEVDRKDSTKIIRRVPMVFDLTQVAKVDTVYMENINTGDLDMEITKFVELKAK